MSIELCCNYADYFNPTLFANKRAVILGASSGIGLEAGKAFSLLGGVPIIISRSPEKIQKASSEIANSVSITGDISTVDGCKQIYKEVSVISNTIDCLVISAGCFYQESLENATEENWDLTVDCNLKGMFFAIKHLLPLLERGENKSIVVLSSILGSFGAAGVAAYSASKGGVTTLVKALSIELAEKGIRINSISPSYIETPMTAAILSGSEQKERIIQDHPLRRVGNPSDVANLIVFLLSASSSWMTGSNLMLDGGRSASM
jgi:NAD(P)-dependent dehydrogenase (short-subunit alcohol dehydrogenase family)